MCCFLLGAWSAVSAQVSPDTVAQAEDTSLVSNDSLPLNFPLADSLMADSLLSDSSLNSDLGPPDSTFLSGSFPPDSLPPANPQDERQQGIIDSLRRSSDLDATVSYNGADSIVFDVRSGKLFLYTQATLSYQDINLRAEYVEVDIEKRQLQARRKPDAAEDDPNLPEFTQGEETYRAQTMSYNFGSGKARVTGGKLVQEDVYVLADVAKYQQDGSFHGADGKFTTCDLDHPHYYIEAKKLKVLPSRQIITGPLRPVLAGLPIPIYLPFGFIPGNLSLSGKKR
ncbi:MAG: hypothetical protein AAF804_13970, partial [Bacteroidota bacterium]